MKLGYKNLILIFFLLAIVFESKGEYRIYQYLIKNKNGSEEQPYLDQSSLDPVSYQAYHGGLKTIDISLLRSWICRGNTSYLKTCTPPLRPLNQIGINL
jgi:hypothetical protein